MFEIANVRSCDGVATGAERTGSCNAPSCDSVATASCPFERRSLLAELQAKGVRITKQRRSLLQAIQTAAEHIDAATLLERARALDPDVDRATVYRTVSLLKKHGLIDELDLMRLRGEKHYYEPKTRSYHAHLACLECGRIEEFSSLLLEQLRSEIAARSGFRASAARVEVAGKCRACSAASMASAQS